MLTAETFDPAVFMEEAGPRRAQAGRAYYAQGRTRMVSIGPTSVRVTVQGTQIRPYVVDLSVVDDWIFSDCSCPDVIQHEVTCKHIVAAVLHVHDQLLLATEPWRQLFNPLLGASPGRGTAQLLLLSLLKRAGFWTLVPYLLPAKTLPAAVWADPVQVADLAATPQVSQAARVPRSPVRPDQVVDAHQAALPAANMVLSLSLPTTYRVPMQATTLLATALSLLPPVGVFLGTERTPFQRPLRLAAERGQLGLHGTQAADGLRVTPVLQLGTATIRLDQRTLSLVLPEYGWALLGDQLLRYDDPTGVLAAFAQQRTITIPPSQQPAFLSEYVVPLAARLPLSGDLPQQTVVGGPPAPRLYLREVDGDFQAAFRLGYGPYEVPYDPQLPPRTLLAETDADPSRLVQIERDPATEQAHWQDVLQHGLKRSAEPGVAALRGTTTLAAFLLRQVPQLAAGGWTIYGEETLLGARVNRHPPTMTLRVSSGQDWFDLEAVVRFGDIAVDLAELRRAIRRREKFVTLADGSLGELPEDWFARYRHLFAVSEGTDQQLRLRASHAPLLDSLLTDTDTADAAFQALRERVRGFTQLTPRPLPASLDGVLRSYQQAGYDWLHGLHDYGLGGCLADDMGTGKTLQTLAFLSALRESGHAQASDLLVLPRSLIFNWQREIARWTPGLRILVHTDQGRSADVAAFADVDLVLTTYGTLLRDLDLFVRYRFHYVVLDEAQAIKNPAAQTARAARALQSDHRLTLTGTPVENGTLELWSQFAFLNPGMLGSLEHFRATFATPIERDGDHDAAQRLRQLVYPFLLRRTKAQVAPELPARTERIISCEMEPAQRKLYTRYRDQYRAQLLQLIDTGGMQEARMQVLEGLLRLRQLCNHPRLVDPTFRGQSAKLTVVLDMLETIQQEGHKALVFSQFVQMLGLVREALDERGIRYAYLDGQTRQRAAAVDAFQSDPTLPFFLISLKAGGVGLNLTAADHVIHIDPWWNPAVEQQATDRSHRIGQDKPVFIAKCIVRETVEEKILALQERKRTITEQVIASETGLAKHLTREDVAALFS